MVLEIEQRQPCEQDGHGKQQDRARDDHRAGEQRDVVPRNVRGAPGERRRQQVHRSGDDGKPDKCQPHDPQFGSVPKAVRREQRGVERPAPRCALLPGQRRRRQQAAAGDEQRRGQHRQARERQPAGADLEGDDGEADADPCRHQEEEHRKRAVQRHELAVRLDAQQVLVGLRELGAEDGAEDAAGDEEGQRDHETERPDGLVVRRGPGLARHRAATLDGQVARDHFIHLRDAPDGRRPSPRTAG